MGGTEQIETELTAAGHLHAGIAHSRSGRHERALEHYRHAVMLNPHYGEAHYNLGHALSALGYYEKAIESYDRAISLNPEVPEIRYNKGNALVELKLFSQAILCFEQAIALRPDYREAHQNLGNTLLAAGDFERGYALYEWRWQGGEKSAYKNRKFPPPRWDGTPLERKTILVWGEQGLGDEIVFASLYPELLRRASRCLFEVEPRLVNLFRRSFPNAVIVPRSDPPAPELLAADIDFEAPAGDLMRWLMPTFDQGPDRENYLRADPDQVAVFKNRYAEKGARLTVGLGWQTVHPKVRVKNSVPVDVFDALARVPQVQFVNLQYGDHREEIEALKGRTGISLLQDTVNPLVDVDGYAAQIKSLDLVVSIVNSTAVLASALGVPVWGLVPHSSDWRWGNDGATCDWYPSMRLYRGTRQDGWASPFGEIARDLEAQVCNKKPDE